MKTRKILVILISALVFVSFQSQANAAPMGTAFTYQGHLYDANQVANNLYDFQFKLYDANSGGTKKGNDVNIPDVDVIDGYFTVNLDFGSSVFDGNAVWLQIGVRQGNLSDPNVYNILLPRQLVTPTPYAIKANTFNVPADVSGSTSATNAVIKATNTGNGYGLYGYSLSNYGVYGYSSAVPGIYGYSGSVEGVYGTNGAWGNYGYLGGNNYGVYGYAYNGTGGYFESNSSYALHAKGPSYIQGIFQSTNSSGGIKLIANNAQAYELQSLNDGGFTLYDRTDGRYCMKIDTSGKMGIGTITPDANAKLSVADDVGVMYTVKVINSGDTGKGVYSVATNHMGVGVYGHTTGQYSIAVVGYAQYDGAEGGLFMCDGNSGFGVHAEASGLLSKGVVAGGTQYDFYANGPGADYGSSSSIRWKREIRQIDEPLVKLMALRGVYFNWDPNHGGQHDVGMIAEEVGKVLPEIVQYEQNGIDAIGMDYSKTTPLLVEAVKALKTEVDQLQKENADLRKRMETIEKMRTGDSGLQREGK
jgi:hypothetical protein